AGRDEQAVFETSADLGDGSEQTLAIILRQNHGAKHLLGKFRLSVTTAPRPVKAQREIPKDVLTALAIESAKRSDAQKKTIADYYRTIALLLEPVRLELAQRERARDSFFANMRRSLVSVYVVHTVSGLVAVGCW